MTDMLEEAIAKIRTLPDSDQDEAAAMLLSVASRNETTVALDAETRAAIREGLEQARRGEFVPDEEIDELWKRHGV
jgi:predicted transcriptional regulator